jgi:hypothetical protein
LACAFLSGTPQLAVLRPAREVAFMCDLLQSGPYYDFTLIVEEGLSWDSTQAQAALPS